MQGRRGPGMGHGPGGPHGMFQQKARAANVKGTLARMFGYMWRYKGMFFLILLMVIATSLAGLAGPYYIGEVINALSPDAAAGLVRVDFGTVTASLLALALFYLIGVVLSYFQTLFTNKLSQFTVRDMREQLFERVQRLSIQTLESRAHGEWMSRMTNDIDNVYNTLSQGLTQFLSSICTVAGAVAMMLTLSPLMTLVSIVTLPLSLLCGRGIVKAARKYFSRQQRALGAINSHIEEMVEGRETVQAFCYEGEAIRRFEEGVSELRGVSMRAQIISGVMGPFMNIINHLSFIIVAAAGGYMAISGALSVGAIAAFIQYSRQFGRPINEIANQFNALQSAIAGAERVFEAMDNPPEADSGALTAEAQSDALAVRFEHVSFSYVENVPVLRDFSLDVSPGQKVALVGPTGAGKTTVINLLARFYELSGGAIYIGGRDTRDIEKRELRSMMAVVLQDTHLFTGTVADNIRRGKLDATDDEVRAAARLADADLFIERLPEGYNTMLNQSGATLSKGQRQLLSIARAALKNPRILILDEATSNVDTRTEMRIQRAMIRLMQGRTSFIIAHRLSTIRDASVILVIDKGDVVESGSHQELLNRRGVYYNLYQSQFNRDEAV